MKTPEEIQKEIEKIDNLWKTSQIIEAKTLALKLLEQSEVRTNSENFAKVNSLLGIIYSNVSDFPKALEYFFDSLEINEKIQNQEAIGANLTNIGNVYMNLSDYSKALEYYEKSLDIYENIGNKYGFAASLIGIGVVYTTFSDFNKALEYYNKSLHLYEEINYNLGVANVVGNIGHVYLNLEDYPKALEYIEKSLYINEEIGNKAGVASNLSNIGDIYLKLSNYSLAMQYFEKALEINTEIGDREGVALNQGNLGLVSKELSQYSVALEYFMSAYTLSEEIGTKKFTMEVLNELSEICEKMGENDTAFSYYKQSIAIEREILTKEAKSQAERFDNERKKAESDKHLAVERARFEERELILRNILPDAVTNRLVKGENPIADYFESVSVIFMDLVGFTPLASKTPPQQLVFLLDAIFQKADEVVESFGLEKVKTIGDGYLAVANVTSPLEHHQKATALAALHLLETMRDFVVNIPSDLGDTDWTKSINDIEIRIGIHSGEVVAGIIGKNKYTYDLWGDAVNVASRMESYSEAGRIHISEAFAKSIESHPEFSLIPRGEISIKGKGTMNTFWLEKGR